MRTHYVLIDYENVQPSSLAELDAEHIRVLLFVGASQNKLTFDIAVAVQKLGRRAEYIKIAGNGSNALDFHIAFHIGHLAAQDPTAFFYIISKDTGFDPLIQHLKERKVRALRSNTVADIRLPKAVNSKTTPERIQVVVAHLQRQGAAKPRTRETLSNSINSLYQKKLTESELVELLKGLQAKGFITVNDTKITYSLPASRDPHRLDWRAACVSLPVHCNFLGSVRSDLSATANCAPI